MSLMIPLLTQTVPPAFEPVSPAALMTQLGLDVVSDPTLQATLNAQLLGAVVAARLNCEKYERRVYGLQTCMVQYDRFPRHRHEYDHHGRPSLRLPLAPFVGITSFAYVDLTGTVQTLPVDTTYGSDPNLPAFAYQILGGSETQQARLLPAYYRYWPFTRRVEGAVQITFQCGYATAADVPVNVQQAILMLAQFYYLNGGATDMAIPRVVQTLLNQPAKVA